MQQFFYEGGAGMYPTAAFGLASLILACLYAARPQPRLVPLVACTGGAALLSGTLGMFMGFQHTIAGVLGPRAPAPDCLPFITLAGLSESSNNMVLALVLATLTVLVLGVGGFRAAPALTESTAAARAHR